MGFKYERRSVNEIVSTSEELSRCAGVLARVAIQMRENSMDSAIFPWVTATWKSIASVVELAAQMEAMIPEQVFAKKQRRKSKYELSMEKSVVDVAKRNAKKVPVKPEKSTSKPRKKATNLKN